MNKEFWINLLSDVEVRNSLTSEGECSDLIDRMENEIEHEELPSHYDWLIARRNSFRSRAQGE